MPDTVLLIVLAIFGGERRPNEAMSLSMQYSFQSELNRKWVEVWLCATRHTDEQPALYSSMMVSSSSNILISPALLLWRRRRRRRKWLNDPIRSAEKEFISSIAKWWWSSSSSSSSAVFRPSRSRFSAQFPSPWRSSSTHTFAVALQWIW